MYPGWANYPSECTKYISHLSGQHGSMLRSTPLHREHWAIHPAGATYPIDPTMQQDPLHLEQPFDVPKAVVAGKTGRTLSSVEGAALTAIIKGMAAP